MFSSPACGLRSQTIFLRAPGGAGKTFVRNLSHTFVPLCGTKVYAVAISPAAAVVLPGGRKAHLAFKIPVLAAELSTSNIIENSELAQQLRDADLVVWDEALMCHRFCCGTVHRSLRDLGCSSILLGGQSVV